MNACNPAKFSACIKNRTIQELSRRTNSVVTKNNYPCTVLYLFWLNQREQERERKMYDYSALSFELP